MKFLIRTFTLALLVLPPLYGQDRDTPLLKEVRSWQQASIPTGREAFFLEKLASQLKTSAGPAFPSQAFDSAGNFILTHGPHQTAPDLTVVCFVDEPTFIVSGRRRDEYFGVRPLFFQRPDPDWLRTWVGNPLKVIDARGKEHYAAFLGPSIHLHGRDDSFWKGLSERDLFLDTGKGLDESEIDILDRVVKNRTFDELLNHRWIGTDLGRRLNSLALSEVARHFKGDRDSGTVQLVFLVQSRFGQRGFQTYLGAHRPGLIVVLSTSAPGPAEAQLLGPAPQGAAASWSERLQRQFPLKPAANVSALRLLGPFTYVVPEVEQRLGQTPLVVLPLLIRHPTQAVDEVSADPVDPDAFPTYLRRLLSCFSD